MKIKILSAILFLTILYGVYGPTDDGREPLRSDISDPVEL